MKPISALGDFGRFFERWVSSLPVTFDHWPTGAEINERVRKNSELAYDQSQKATLMEINMSRSVYQWH